MASTKCTFYIKPAGKTRIQEIHNVYEEDAKYINDNDIQLSMEELFENMYAVYFDDGTEVNGQPDEILVMSKGRTCQETIKEGVQLLKERKL